MQIPWEENDILCDEELESEAYEEAMSRRMRRKLALEEENAWKKDPLKVKAARESAKAAVYMYTAVPLSREERKARLAGEVYIDKPIDLDRMYYYWRYYMQHLFVYKYPFIVNIILFGS